MYNIKTGNSPLKLKFPKGKSNKKTIKNMNEAIKSAFFTGDILQKATEKNTWAAAKLMMPSTKRIPVLSSARSTSPAMQQITAINIKREKRRFSLHRIYPQKAAITKNRLAVDFNKIVSTA